MKTILLVFLVFPFLSFSQLEGDWYSSFVVMGQSMRMKITVENSGTEPTVQLEDIDHSYVMDGDRVVLTDTSLSFEWTQGGLAFQGIYNPQEDRLEGTMKQSGIQWEALFYRKIQELIEVNRPQTPQAPFPYTEEKISIPNGEIVLGATLTLPENFDASTPIVVLASGSGPQNRNCELLGHQPFWVISDHFARNGIASLRFDDRGVGESSGSFATASLEDFGSDVEACAKYLRKTQKFKKNPLGLAGHSEGGMHILIAATNYKKVDFLLELAAVGTTGKEVLVKQQYDMPIANGSSIELAEWNKQLFEGMSDIILANETQEASSKLVVFLGNAYDNAPKDFDKSSTTRMAFILSSTVFLNNDWGRQFLAFRTEDYLNKLKIPVLAIHGLKDMQVSPESNSAAFASHGNVTAYKMPDLNHLFQTCETGSMNEYGELEETWSVDVLNLMTDWILHLAD